MMKKVCLITLATLMISFSAFAYTVEMKARTSNTYISVDDFLTPMAVSFFGKPLLSESYGVMVHIKTNEHSQKPKSFDEMFYPVEGKILKKDKKLYYQKDDQSPLQLLAKRGLLGSWNPIDGVEINTELVEGNFYYQIYVTVEIN